MDPFHNPFSPGAGTPPPELVGRDAVLGDARLLFHRKRAGKSEKSMLMTGLRGVGKTVLLNEMRQEAEKLGLGCIMVEAPEERSLADLLAPGLKSMLFKLDRMKGVSDRVKRAIGVFRGFLGTPQVTINDIQFGIAYDPVVGADSGDLEADLAELLSALGEAAQDRQTGIVLMIDEVQYLKPVELAALITAQHRLEQRQLPVMLIAAGLPTIRALSGDAKSYAERLFSFPEIGPLSREECFGAIERPMDENGVRITKEALSEIYKQTSGYPYFVQEWGYLVWNSADSSPIEVRDVRAASSKAISRLDESFFRVRYDRVANAEKKFLRAMAEAGNSSVSIGFVAEMLGRQTTALGPTRAKLIAKGMVYSPAHGEIAFTVPLFGDFMRRVMPSL